jgi:hypothetical protein
MALDSFLNASDSARVARSLRMLAAHDISGWALTGGIAMELHVLRCGGEPVVRPLHDIDFLVSSFESIPETLGRELLLRHVHPDDPPGKNMRRVSIGQRKYASMSFALMVWRWSVLRR